MSVNTTIIEDNLGRHYLLQTARTSHTPKNADPMRFGDTLSAESFLRYCRDYHSLWRRLAYDADIQVTHQRSSLAVVAQQIIRGKITLYALPRNYRDESRIGAIKGTNNQYFQLVNAAEAMAHPNVQPASLANKEQALALLQSLDLNGKQVAELQNQLGLASSGNHSSANSSIHSSDHALEALSDAIANGDVVVLDQGKKMGPRAKPSSIVEEAANNMPGNRPVPLAPEAEATRVDYIEIVLLYDDGEPVAEQKYWIKDAEGGEYEGTTDAQGKARIDSIPMGNCDISFPDLDAWS